MIVPIRQALVLTVWWVATASAGVTTPVAGALGPVENGCLLVSAFYFGVDCGYTRRDDPQRPWVGPTLGPVYFAPDDPHGVPTYTPGTDEQPYSPALQGTIAVDTRDTPVGSDDLVSGQLIVGPAQRSHLSRIDDNTPPQRAVERWTQISHTWPPTAVTYATPNAAGGFDYVIASLGMPPRLCRQKAPQDCFPSALASMTGDGRWGANTWAQASPIPVGRSPLLGGNVGLQTTGVIEGYLCADTAGGAQCEHGVNLWGSREDPGWDNVLLLVRTDSQGRVMSAEGFWLNEYRVDAGPPDLRGPSGQDNSWLGGYWMLTGAGHPETTQ